MSQFVVGSMDVEKVKKPLLSSAMKKPPSSSLAKAQVASLLGALLFACLYAAFAADSLRDPCQETVPVPVPVPETEPASWLNQSYEVTGADNVDAMLALLRGLMWCSAPQAAAAALALALLAAGRSRRGLDVRTAASVALAATAASHCMYLRATGLIDTTALITTMYLLLVLNTVVILAATAIDLIVFMTFVLGVDE